MTSIVLSFLYDFLLYLFIAGALIFVLLYFIHTDIDKILKKSLLSMGYEVISIEDTPRVFDVHPKKKPWSRFIRTTYGGATDRINYRIITLLLSEKEQKLLAAVYTAPFVKPQVFYERDIKKAATVK